MQPKCSFKVGTPVPVIFRETFGMPDKYDFNLAARCAMSINVAEYDESKYGDYDQLKKTIKYQFQEILTNVLNKKMKGSVMRGIGSQKHLNAAVEEELASMDVTASVEIISFALTEESDKLYKEKIEEAKIIKMPDISNYKSDCVPPPPFDPSKNNMPMGTFKQMSVLTSSDLEKVRET